VDSMVLPGNAVKFSAIAPASEGGAPSPRKTRGKAPGVTTDKAERFEAGGAHEKCLFVAQASSPDTEAGLGVVKGKPPDPKPARIVAFLWDVGGGNFFNPNAKITLDIHGTHASKATLSVVNSKGVRTELQSLPCRDGERIQFNAKYNRASTQAMEICLFDSQEHVLAELKRNTP